MRFPIRRKFGQAGKTLLDVFAPRFDIHSGDGRVRRQKRAVDQLPLFAGFNIFAGKTQVFEATGGQIVHERVVSLAQLTVVFNDQKEISIAGGRRFLKTGENLRAGRLGRVLRAFPRCGKRSA